MKHLLAHFGFILVTVAGSLTAEPEAQPQMSITEGASNSWNFDWEGIAGRTYFFQYSLDLINWENAPFIDYGEGIHSYGMSCSTDKMFFRLLYIDPETDDPIPADTDGDGLSDYDEIMLGTSPTNPDSDGNGISDGDAVALGINPLAGELGFLVFSPLKKNP